MEATGVTGIALNIIIRRTKRYSHSHRAKPQDARNGSELSMSARNAWGNLLLYGDVGESAGPMFVGDKHGLSNEKCIKEMRMI